jgi:hypothetical protein
MTPSAAGRARWRDLPATPQARRREVVSHSARPRLRSLPSATRAFSRCSQPAIALDEQALSDPADHFANMYRPLLGRSPRPQSDSDPRRGMAESTSTPSAAQRPAGSTPSAHLSSTTTSSKTRTTSSAVTRTAGKRTSSTNRAAKKLAPPQRSPLLLRPRSAHIRDTRPLKPAQQPDQTGAKSSDLQGRSGEGVEPSKRRVATPCRF